jgi:hypothetical protein
MTSYLLLAAAVAASHLCRLATVRGHAKFRFFDKPLAGLALFGTILVVGDLRKLIDRSEWWAGVEGHAFVEGALYFGLALLVIFVLLPSAYSNNKIAEQAGRGDGDKPSN